MWGVGGYILVSCAHSNTSYIYLWQVWKVTYLRLFTINNYKCHSGCLYKVFKYQSCNSSLPVPANDHLITFNWIEIIFDNENVGARIITSNRFLEPDQGSRWRAIRAKKSWLLTSLCTSAKREVEVALLILTVLTVKHWYIFTTKFPFFKPPL